METQLWLNDLAKVTSGPGALLFSLGLMLPLSLQWKFYEMFVVHLTQPGSE